MNIAIIGGGFTGLTAAYTLSKQGHAVTIFEKEPYLGGLAYGFTRPDWQWHIEAAYHHLFTNDRDIISLIHELGISDSLIIKRPVTSTLWQDAMYQLDSPKHLLLFPGLSFTDKIRTAALLGFFKLFPVWRLLERTTAERILISVGGRRAWSVVWEPLLYGKFSTYAPKVSASWFWARIVKRTPSLCYIRGGFHTAVSALEQAIITQRGVIHTATPVDAMKRTGHDKYAVRWGKNQQTFNAVLLTVPTPFAANIAPMIPASYIRPLMRIPHVSAQTLIVETDRPILKNVYWLNVTDRSFPFLAAVAHTNFMDPKYYGGHHLTYFGNYLPDGHPLLSMNKSQVLKTFLPHIKRLAPNARYTIRHTYLFTGPFAQPVHEVRYSENIPPIATPLPNLFMANMDYVVPWDRGTNYAVELGARAAACILKETT